MIDALKDSGRGVGEIDAQGSPEEVFGPVADFMAKYAAPKGEVLKPMPVVRDVTIWLMYHKTL